MATALVTRPERGNIETMARLVSLGHEGVASPLLRIVALRAALPAPAAVDAVVAASRNAVDGVPDCFAAHPLFAVGNATARYAAARFRDVRSADGDATALAALVASAQPPGARLLLATARAEGFALARALRARHTVIRRAVYAQSPAARLPDAARAALEAGTLTHALFFSARTAAVFSRLLAADRGFAQGGPETVRGIVAVTIGPAAAVALGGLPWRDLLVAARPTQDEMLAVLS